MMTMKKVRHNGKVMNKFDICWEIDRIKYSWAVVYMECDNYNYWKGRLLTAIEKYCPERLGEFTNLY